MWKRYLYRSLSLAVIGSLSLLAQPTVQRRNFVGPPDPEPRYVAPRPVPTMADAVPLALADALRFPPEVRCDLRYILAQEGERDGRARRIASVLIQYLHRAATVVRPDVLPGGFLYRVNLRELAPQNRDYEDFKRAWEQLAFDPSASRLFTRDQLQHVSPEYWPTRTTTSLRTVKKTREIAPARGEWKRVTHRGGRLIADDDYQTDYGVCEPKEYDVWHRYKAKTEEYEVEEEVKETVGGPSDDIAVVRINSRAVNEEALKTLQSETHSLAPVVDLGYLGHRGFRAVRNAKDYGLQNIEDRVFEQVFGGLYYDFVGVRLAQDVFGKGTKVTDLDLFFQDFGIGSVGEKVDGKQRGVRSVETIFNELRSDQRAIIVASDVTAKPRIVRFLEGSAGIIRITDDLLDTTIDIGDIFYRNLDTARPQAREAIGWKKGTRGFRFPVFLIANGEGKRVNVVPQPVADDRRIPKPHPQSLQPGLSCLGCHSIEGKDGVQIVRNDIHKITTVTDIFGELRRFGHNAPLLGRHRIVEVNGKRYVLDPDTVDRITGAYKGNFSVHVDRLRDDLAEATLLAVYGRWEEDEDGHFLEASKRDDPAGVNICKTVAVNIERRVGGWWWNGVDARQALFELGLDVVPRQAVATFKQLLPPDSRNLVRDQHGNVVLVQQDPVEAILASGGKVSRSAWSLSRDWMAEKIVKNPEYVKLRTGGRPR